jgi:proliferating cell nuclear antigen
MRRRRRRRRVVTMGNNIVEIYTVQGAAIKALVEALRELLTENRIEFDVTGIRIIDTDKDETVLVHLKLDAKRFDAFYCAKKTVICVNMLLLNKLLKGVNQSHALTLFIEDEEPPSYLGIRIETPEKNSRTTYRLQLQEVVDEPLEVPAEEFSSVLTLPSADFNKICRDMANLGEPGLLEIKNIRNQLIFTCQSDWCTQETVIKDSEDVVPPKGQDAGSGASGGAGASGGSGASGGAGASGSASVPLQDWAAGGGGAAGGSNEIVQGVFPLKTIVHFCKCKALSSTVEIFMKNNYPLILRFAVAQLGEIKLCVVQHEDADAASAATVVDAGGGGFGGFGAGRGYFQP